MLKLRVESLKLRLFLAEVDFSLILFLVLYGLTVMLSFIDVKSNFWINKVLRFFSKMWNFKGLRTRFSASTSLKYFGVLSRSLDHGWLEKRGPQGAYEFFKELRLINQTVQSSFFLKRLFWSLFLFFILVCVNFFYY